MTISGSTKVVSCPTCRPHAQDKMHGDKKRVANKTNKEGGYRCTVCGQDITVGGGAKVEGKKAKASK